MARLSDKTLIPLGLAIVTIGGGAFWLSDLHAQVQATRDEVSEIKADVKVLAGMRTDIEVIKSEIQRIEPPIYHTRLDVKKVKEVVEAREGSQKEVGSGPINQGPFSMIDLGR